MIFEGNIVVKIRVEKKIGDSVLAFETGQLAKQATACVLCQYGDTVVLNAVSTGPSRPGTDFFPLTCDYRERFAAAGKFLGGWTSFSFKKTAREFTRCREPFAIVAGQWEEVCARP